MLTSLYKDKSLKVKIQKLHHDAVIPKYSKNGDAGMDITAVSKYCDDEGNVVYGTGLAFEIPKGYVGLIFPRSSNAKQDLLLSNSVGVIDSGYRGEVMLKFKPSMDVSSSVSRHDKTDCSVSSASFGTKLKLYNLKDRIGQIIIIPYPQVEFQLVEKLSTTERGAGGYGSTGK